MVVIVVKYLLMYDVYNFCEMVYENKILLFKVKMFREICKYFEILFNMRDIKFVLV